MKGLTLMEFYGLASRIEFTSTCWLWKGKVDKDGYGELQRGRRRTKVHRYMYELFVAPIPRGLVIDHRCRVRGCVNPDHLRPVTARVNTLENSLSVAALNAAKTHCDYGHPFDEANTYAVLTGGRTCRQCHARHERERRRRIKQAKEQGKREAA